MSLHKYCEKCKKHLGGIWPMENATAEENEEMFNKFFKSCAKHVCENLNDCPYGE